MRDINGVVLEGTEESPFEINCIEDLVSFSNMVNMGADVIQYKYVVLKRELNFQSKFSYTDYRRTDFGDINGNTEDGNELITEMTTGKGFKPIGYSRACTANFNGNNKMIKKIYINYAKEDGGAVGLFSNIINVENVQLTGSVSGNWHTGGIVGDNRSIIKNCINYATVTGYNMVGGIAGSALEFSNCINYGTVYSTGNSYAYGGCGGIVGYTDGKIENCKNYGQIKGKSYLGGIMGTTQKEAVIQNSYNYGNCYPEKYGSTGGIIGFNRAANVKVLNCGNQGNISGEGTNGGIIGNASGSNWDTEVYLTIQNCYNTGTISSSNNVAGGLVGNQGTVAAINYIIIENSWNIGEIDGIKAGGIQGNVQLTTDTKTQYNKVFYTNTLAVPEDVKYEGEAIQKTVEEIKSQEFVNLLNQNIGEHTEWKKWKLGEDEYPIFE